jgi:hypothetical protein
MGLCRKFWYWAMGYCGKLGYVVRAAVANLAISFGPLHGMSQTVKKFDYFSGMANHSAGFGYALWATAQDLVMSYGL